jgi:hypothetical protein
MLLFNVSYPKDRDTVFIDPSDEFFLKYKNEHVWISSLNSRRETLSRPQPDHNQGGKQTQDQNQQSCPLLSMSERKAQGAHATHFSKIRPLSIFDHIDL